MAAENARLKAETERLRALEEEAKDPLTFLAKRGVPAKEIGDRIIRQGTPEDRFSRLEAELKAEREARAKERSDREATEAKARAAQHQAAAEAALAKVHEELKTSGEAPLLGAMSKARVIREYMATYQELLADPETAPFVNSYSDKEILQGTEVRLRTRLGEELDDLEESFLDGYLQERKKRASSKAEEGAKSAPAIGRQEPEAATSRAKPLTNAVASESSGSWKPADWDKLSDKKQNSILVDRLKKGLRCD